MEAPAVESQDSQTSPRRRPGDLELKKLREISLAEDVAEAAKEEPTATQLTESGELAVEVIAELLAKCGEARILADKVIEAKSAKIKASAMEVQARKRLILRLRDIQRRAKRAFGSLSPEHAAKRKHYRVGKRLGSTLVSLEQDSEIIIGLAKADAASLPGWNDQKLESVILALDVWRTASESQDAAEKVQAERLVAFSAAVAKVNDDRRDIQLAADELWPYHDSASTPVRRRFKISTERPLG